QAGLSTDRVRKLPTRDPAKAVAYLAQIAGPDGVIWEPATIHASEKASSVCSISWRYARADTYARHRHRRQPYPLPTRRPERRRRDRTRLYRTGAGSTRHPRNDRALRAGDMGAGRPPLTRAVP